MQTSLPIRVCKIAVSPRTSCLRWKESRDDYVRHFLTSFRGVPGLLMRNRVLRGREKMLFICKCNPVSPSKNLPTHSLDHCYIVSGRGWIDNGNAIGVDVALVPYDRRKIKPFWYMVVVGQPGSEPTSNHLNTPLRERLLERVLRRLGVPAARQNASTLVGMHYAYTSSLLTTTTGSGPHRTWPLGRIYIVGRDPRTGALLVNATFDADTRPIISQPAFSQPIAVNPLAARAIASLCRMRRAVVRGDDVAISILSRYVALHPGELWASTVLRREWGAYDMLIAIMRDEALSRRILDLAGGIQGVKVRCGGNVKPTHAKVLTALL